MIIRKILMFGTFYLVLSGTSFANYEMASWEQEVKASVNSETIEKQQASIDQLELKIDELKNEISLLRGLVESEIYKLNKVLDSSLNASNSESKLNDSQYEFSENSDEDAYKKSYKMIIAKDYENAILAFNQFIKQFSNSEYLPNAHYWLGELFLREKNYSKATEQFDKVINKYPSSPKVASAMLKRALCLIGLRKYQDAKSQLSLITKNFPSTSTALIAKKQLDKLENM